jgi:hypothetical protein
MEVRRGVIDELDNLVDETSQTTKPLHFIPEANKRDGGSVKLNNYQMNIGHPYAGASVHFHGPTMSTLLFGMKHFFMFPPKDAFYNTEQIYQWYQASHPSLKRNGLTPLECMQQPGDVIFIPDAWAHGLLYLKESISISYLYAKRAMG